MRHAAPQPPRRTADRYPMDEQTEDLADTIEAALEEVVGFSPIYRVLAEHAARVVQNWIDYQLQRGELRVIVTAPPDPPEPAPAPSQPSEAAAASPES